ncbi:GNAT family N-acetyltransferase [Methyloradius palustris]|uniref:N-acetyltransferase n=1 Tax=Methyloradius palustris TaxID=2778876 RepID=A0A8D5G3T3_9PROT|nr:GNAT family N-acetyltransferase [Methyloradius palustris]BCM25245.1 N-acetyltransferase [Methyloradius palustris]
MNSSVTYLTNTSIPNDIEMHLRLCDEEFLNRLSSKVDIHGYAQKIVDLAYRFEAWELNKLIGLLAVYCNGQEHAFITNISVLPAWQGKHVARELMQSCIQYLNTTGLMSVQLSVDKENLRAITFYKKCNFEIAQTDDLEIMMRLRLGITQL